MKRQNTLPLGEVLQEILNGNPQIKQNILESRAERGWFVVMRKIGEQYTRNVYVKNKVLYVSLNSSVFRNELLLNKDRLIKAINDYCEDEAIVNIVIR